MLTTPDAQLPRLTPEQRDRYREERWSLYHAKTGELSKVGNEERYDQALNALDDFAEQGAWFSEYIKVVAALVHASNGPVATQLPSGARNKILKNSN